MPLISMEFTCLHSRAESGSIYDCEGQYPKLKKTLKSGHFSEVADIVFTYYLFCKQTFYQYLNLEVRLPSHRKTQNTTRFNSTEKAKCVISTKVHIGLMTMEVLC